MKLLKQPWKHDARSRKFKSTRFYGAIALKPTLGKVRFKPLDQGNTTRCAAFAAAMNGRYIHGIEMSTDWQTDKISRLQGSPVDNGGSDPNAAMASQMYAKKGGYLPKTSFNPDNPSSNDDEALDFGCEAYIKPASGKDHFDSICIELQRHFDEAKKRGANVQMFTEWHDTFTSGTITKLGTIQGYHSYLAIDFDRHDFDESKHFLVLHNSYGEYYGNQGFHIMFRPQVNALLSRWGNSDKIVTVLTDEQIREAKKDTPLGRLLTKFIQVCFDLSVYLAKRFGV